MCEEEVKQRKVRTLITITSLLEQINAAAYLNEQAQLYNARRTLTGL